MPFGTYDTEEDEIYYDDDSIVIKRAFCDSYEVHEDHVYVALNAELYKCPGMTAEDLAAIYVEENRTPCEHGLSQTLCSGPQHYPSDNRF